MIKEPLTVLPLYTEEVNRKCKMLALPDLLSRELFTKVPFELPRSWIVTVLPLHKIFACFFDKT